MSERENKENMNIDRNRPRIPRSKPTGRKQGFRSDGWNCPLCMEKVDDQDVDFTPCECGYQICRFCWHHIKTVLGNKCPACRRPYDNDAMLKKDVKEEQYRAGDDMLNKSRSGVPLGNVLPHRKHLVDLRVLQPNLVYVIGIPLSPGCYNLPESVSINGSSVSYLEDLLASEEYFGKYGKLVKLVINLKGQHLTAPIARKDDPEDKMSKRPVATVSAFLTFEKKEEAAEAIKHIDEMLIDRFPLRATYGTTKYCAFFLRGQTCPNMAHCLYLHELGEEHHSYTKEALSARQRDTTRLKRDFDQTLGKEEKQQTVSPPPGIVPATMFSPGVFPCNDSDSWRSDSKQDSRMAAIGTMTPMPSNRPDHHFDPLDPSNDIRVPASDTSPQTKARLNSRFGFANSLSMDGENPFLAGDEAMDLRMLEEELDNANREAKILETKLLEVVRRNRAYIHTE